MTESDLSSDSDLPKSRDEGETADKVKKDGPEFGNEEHKFIYPN
jgi:hypothetical protein